MMYASFACAQETQNDDRIELGPNARAPFSEENPSPLQIAVDAWFVENGIHLSEKSKSYIDKIFGSPFAVFSQAEVERQELKQYSNLINNDAGAAYSIKGFDLWAYRQIRNQVRSRFNSLNRELIELDFRKRFYYTQEAEAFRQALQSPFQTNKLAADFPRYWTEHRDALSDPRPVKIGETIELFRIQDVSFTNDFRLRLQSLYSIGLVFQYVPLSDVFNDYFDDLRGYKDLGFSSIDKTMSADADRIVSGNLDLKFGTGVSLKNYMPLRRISLEPSATFYNDRMPFFQIRLSVEYHPAAIGPQNSEEQYAIVVLFELISY